MQSTMKTLSSNGDDVYSWSPKSKKAVAAAKVHFDTQLGNGFKAYRAGERLTEFDPQAASVIFVPPVQGGYPRG